MTRLGLIGQLALGVLVFGLPACGGPGGPVDGGGVGGSQSGGANGSGGESSSGGSDASGGALGSGGHRASGGATGSGGNGVGGSSAGGTQNLGGAPPSEVDPDELGQPCESGACPTGLTPIVYELCGSATCVMFCDCHLPCEDAPEICPAGSSCQVVFGIEGEHCQ